MHAHKTVDTYILSASSSGEPVKEFMQAKAIEFSSLRNILSYLDEKLSCIL